jgi:hypothetical protein
MISSFITNMQKNQSAVGLARPYLYFRRHEKNKNKKTLRPDKGELFGKL